MNTPSKPVGGFDLVLGRLYNDGWYNYELPVDGIAACVKCHAPTTLYHLHKFIFAFGNITEKFTRVTTCPACLHERQINSPRREQKQKATRKNLAAIFAKLPQWQQKQLLGGLK